MLKFVIIPILISNIFLGSCSIESPIVIDGPLDSIFVEKLMRVPEARWVKVASQGGDPKFANEAAEIILAKELKLEVQGGCFSSCAEYLLPAAFNLKFNNALIGFHQSPPLISELKKMNSPSKKPICYYEKQIKPLIDLHYNRLEVKDFWKQTLKKLNVTKVQLNDIGPCIEVRFRFENEFWLPNSTELQTLYGLDFTGSLCNDDKNCYSEKLDRIAPASTKFIVGDDVYISKSNHNF